MDIRKQLNPAIYTPVKDKYKKGGVRDFVSAVKKPLAKVTKFGTDIVTGKTGSKVIKDIAQGTARNVASLGVSAAGLEEIQPKNYGTVSKFVFGNEPIKGLGKRFSENVEAQKPLLGKYAKYTGPATALLSIGLDITPFGKADEPFKVIAKSTDAKAIYKQLQKLGAKNPEILARQLVKIDDPKRVKTIVDNFIPKPKVNFPTAQPGAIPKALGQGETFTKTPMEKAGFTSRPLFPTSKLEAQAGFAKTPEVMQPTKYAKDIVVEKTYKPNIRFDKFEVSDEGRSNLSRIMEENKNFIDQRRGTMSFGDTQKIAQELVPRAKLKPGTSLNAEELQSLGDTVAGLQTKVEDFSRQISSGNNSDTVVLQLAQAKEELTFALASLSGATAEAGRSLSILRNIRKATESGDTQLIKDALKLSGGRQSAEDIARRLADLGNDNLGKIKYLRDISKVKTTEKIYEVWLNSILSNPLTQAVNVTGNLLNAIMKVPTRAAQAGLQVPGKRKVFFGEVPNQVVGALEGVVEGTKKALYVLRNGISPSQASKLDVQHLPAIKGITGEVVRTPTKMLGAADEFFKAILHTSEMRSLAYRQARQEGLTGVKAYERMHELTANPTKELYEAVDLAKLKGTFQEPLGKFGKSLMQFRDSAPGVKYVIPFIKTPTNIAKEALKTSPAGFLNVARKLLKGQYKDGGLTQELSEDLAKASIGSMISIPVVMAALNGDITGSAPTNTAEKDAFYRSGKQPYSIRVGDKWYSYRRIEPLGTVIGTLADFTQIQNDEGLDQAAIDVATIIGRNLNDKTFLSGISNFIEALTDDEKRSQFAENMATGLIPFSGTQRFITRIIDPVNRKPEGLLEAIKAQTPGLSTDVTPRLDVFGSESKRTKSQALSPVGVTEQKNDKVEAELSRLKLSPGFPSKAIAGQELNNEEYTQYQRISGRVSKEVLDSLVNDPIWETLNDRQREQVIDKTIRKVRDKVAGQLFPYKIKASEIKKRLMDKGLTSEEAEKMTSEIVTDLQTP